MLTAPDSLMAKNYKARYFPTGNFLEAKLGNNPSFTWSSVFMTQGLIKSKALIRVGPSSSIKVFFNPWLPKRDNPKIETIPPLHLKNISVDSLKGADLLSWDIDLL
ncbi:hypothetical protein LguiA_016554 [Lonicera macranthoides]